MYTRIQLAGRLALTTALGLALLSGVSSAPARADDTDKMPKPGRAPWDPMPVGYPMAAPGTINLYHWTDYTQTEIRPGSAMAARREWEYETARDVYAQARIAPASTASIYDPWGWHEPTSIDYPVAAPGTVGLWHWTDYTHTELKLESAREAHIAMENQLSAKQWETQAMYPHSNDPNYHSWGWIDPMPLSYPTAAPGMLGLWHWSDYTQSIMQLGSTEEARIQNQNKVDQQAQDQMNKSQSNK
jgi:hypothetical protein